MSFDILWSRRPGRDSGLRPGAARRPIARPRVEALESRRLLSVTINEFYIPASPASAPTQITAGPDGNLWFTEYFGEKVGRIAVNGIVTEFRLPLPDPESGPYGIAAAPDGNV